jgi:hypothetical protein
MVCRPRSSFVKPSDNFVAADEVIAVLNRFYPTRILISTTALMFAGGLTLMVYHSAPMLGQQKAATASEKSAAGATVTLTCDPAKQSAESFKKIVRQSGYTCK